MANKKTRQLPDHLNYNQPKEPMSDLAKGLLAFTPFFVAIGALATHMYLDRPGHQCAALFVCAVVAMVAAVATVSP